MRGKSRIVKLSYNYSIRLNQLNFNINNTSTNILLQLGTNQNQQIYMQLKTKINSIMLKNQDTVTTELLSRRQFIISNLPANLTKNIIVTHYNSSQYSYCPVNKTYLFKIRHFSSLERILKDNLIKLQKLPDFIFKLFNRIDQIKSFLPSKVIPETVGPWRLLPHQMTQISFFQRRGRIIIGDGWGTGKTITSLAIMRVYEISCALIVCPKILVHYWLQFLLCLFRQQQIKIVQSPADFHLNLQTKTYFLVSHADIKFICANTKIQLLVIDQPQPQCLYTIIKYAKSIIILSRNGERKFCELICLLLGFEKQQKNVLRTKLNERYQMELKGQCRNHIYQFNNLRMLFFICCRDPPSDCMCLKPILLRSISLNQVSGFEQIQNFHRSRLRQIYEYAAYVLKIYQSSLTIIYKSEWILQYLQKIFANAYPKSRLHLLHYRDVKVFQVPKDSVIVFVETFRLEDEDQNCIIESLNHLTRVTHRIQYIKFSQEQEETIGVAFYYPELIHIEKAQSTIDMSEQIQFIPALQIDKK